MEAWVRDKVSLLNLDASVYVDYALGLLQDQDESISERVNSVISVFMGAADGLVPQHVLDEILDVEKMTQDVEKLLQLKEEEMQKASELELEEKTLKDLQLREKQREEAEEAARQEKQKAADRYKNMTRKEMMAREQLVNEYGLLSLSEFDEDGNVVKVKDRDKTIDDIGPSNSNRQRAQEAQNSLREKMKKEHEKKVKYEKELLAKDKARNDKTKKRTMKKEKQRGCG
ncbi:uncharacterized protein PHALS_11624 [Plasmopara halstedii]|uniref:Coiled-coil domain-containing protein 43 n=1 Tax=Plasmopara halstedii TaxID=4781 RepID=A0A0P1AJL8_PLAHL|nr:uncharacterized protein PHALS_11624 [Plasmopara halstedii]CEG41266.1 hypothetical protein PHALS_11624 [Plasmopara halstedii]|eukprot:XP_024577635.1 hypothetical protein PHALS_11624 [Plasmopara halstedii]